MPRSKPHQSYVGSNRHSPTLPTQLCRPPRPRPALGEPGPLNVMLAMPPLVIQIDSAETQARLRQDGGPE